MSRAQHDWESSSGSDIRTSAYSSYSSESDSNDEGIDKPQIFIDAAHYGQVLAEVDEESSNIRRFQTPTRSFVNLVGRDLDDDERTEVEGFAKFIVNSWSQGEDDLDGEATFSLEPEAYEEDEDGVPSVSSTKEPTSDSVSGPLDQVKLSAEEIVRLLMNEFGSLSGGNGEEEKLLGEYDAGICDDIVIVGTLHLTTHRLAFHASLKPIESNLSAGERVIRKGTVTIHKKALRRKRRVWLELTQDMITSYPSSRDEDRIRPLKSILLSSIDYFSPEDPAHPRFVEIRFTDSLGPRRTMVEMDTEESAQEWRRDVKRAILLCRRTLDQLMGNSKGESEAVRINIPFASIKKFSMRPVFQSSTYLSIEVNDPGDEPSISNENGDTKPLFAAIGKSWSGKLDFAVINSDDVLKSMKDILKDVKIRDSGDNIPSAESLKATVDFGNLSFVDNDMNAVEVKDEKESAIRKALALQNEHDIWYTRALIMRNIISRGQFVVTNHFVCFWSKAWGSDTDFQYRLPMTEIKSANISRRLFPRIFGLVLELKSHTDLHFDFTSEDARNEGITRVNAALEAERKTSLLNGYSPKKQSSYYSAQSSNISKTTLSSKPRSNVELSTLTTTDLLSPPLRSSSLNKDQYFTCRDTSKVLNMPSNYVAPRPSKHFICLTIGSRGDVQPYIALGLGLKKEGHKVTIVTHKEYKAWIEGWGITHRSAGGDPGALMKLSVEHKMFSPQFFKESLMHFRSWLDELLVDAWEQCKDAEVLLESPSAMAGVHIAEALSIPYFRTFTMPWTKTSGFPHPFLSPPVDSPYVNTSSYILFDNILWTATSAQINRWRKNVLNLSSTDMGHLAQSKIPFIYNFSAAVVPKPLDWSDSIIISGYWFLDNPDIGWSPSEELLRFIAQAKADQKPLVYIGFGSITVPDPSSMSQNIISAVTKSGVRAIISKGWSDRMSHDAHPELEYPPECFVVDKIPHDWLFPKIDAALHHGGAGTTGASLRAGIPTLIKPWFGDQFFWASRVQKLGVGLKVSSLRSIDLAKALLKATDDRVMQERAAAVGRTIRAENGVHDAIQAIYTYYSRAERSRND